jgi:hypothetical protein
MVNSGPSHMTTKLRNVMKSEWTTIRKELLSHTDQLNLKIGRTKPILMEGHKQ